MLSGRAGSTRIKERALVGPPSPAMPWGVGVEGWDRLSRRALPRPFHLADIGRRTYSGKEQSAKVDRKWRPRKLPVCQGKRMEEAAIDRGLSGYVSPWEQKEGGLSPRNRNVVGKC